MSKKTKTVFYRVHECDETASESICGHWEINNPFWHDDIVEECAKHFHHHSGGDFDGPLTFSLHETEDGPEICRFEVETETVVAYSVTPLAAEADP